MKPAVDKWNNCFGNGSEALSHLEIIDSLDMLRAVKEGECRCEGVYWRGQESFLWTPYPTLFRYLRTGGLSDGQIDEGAIASQEDLIFRKAAEANLIDAGSHPAEFMARLQHYGGPTRLLDVTSDFDTSLFFAVGEGSNCPGVIYRYRINPENVVSLQEKDLGWSDLLSFGGSGVPVLVKPAAFDRRIEIQRGAFVMSTLDGTLAEPNLYTHQTWDSEIKQYLITPAAKVEAREYLARRGLTKAKMLPSIEQFASRCRSEPMLF